MSAGAPPIVCLPGLGADAELFRPQLDAFEGACSPAWPSPIARDETVETLAERTLDGLRRERRWSRRTVVVGFSFGGQVALSMARLGAQRGAPPAAAALVSAPRTDRMLTRRFGLQVAAARCAPPALIAWAARRLVADRFARVCGLDGAQADRLRAMAARLDARAFVRLASAARRWRFDESDHRALRRAGVRVVHLHASGDPVIPPPSPGPGVRILVGRAHLLTWTHARDVRRLIESAGGVAKPRPLDA